ncbi:MAG: methionyl-tRNA formyltransferase [Rhodospirillales bacterium 20-60-12]|nr:MAG: methionyl-tRNA formyltransferase [Rhodospirillales bacterium 20-60-12]HQT66124.1 methionyl-tRNA formyltransferase [Acetobacteraceae bacterium]
MKLAFMGSPDFAVPALVTLHEAGHDIAAVYCQPPKPAHRGQRETRCAVHDAALGLKLPIRTPARLRGNTEEAIFFGQLGLDCAIVAAYGLILPPAILNAPAQGCLNIHASLLPRWRGAGPIQAAILAGDAQTGITIMQMDQGLDTGPILLSEALAIGDEENAAALHDRMAQLGGKLILRALNTRLVPIAQDNEHATYAPKLSRADSPLDWTRPAIELHRRIRAFTPWPGTTCRIGGEIIKISAAHLAEGQGEPGIVLDHKLTIACGQGALRLTRLQRPGRAAMNAADFLRGFPVPAQTKVG